MDPSDDTRSPDEKAFDALLAASERGETLSSRDAAALPEAVRAGFRDLARAAPQPPRRVGDFELIDRIASGGMGVVWLARQTSLKRDVVVKLLRSDRRGGEAEAIFRREAELLAQLQHPNVVRILAFGIEEETAWIAMERLVGRTLAEEIERRGGAPMPIATALPIAIQLASALAAAHAAGIVHRDVKPSNVFVCDDGRAVVLDFGIARELEGPHLTESGAFKGTPTYAAPEQIAAGRGRINEATDVYGLGVTLYEMLVGRRPFTGATAEQVFLEILTREPTPPRVRNPSLSRDVETVVLKAIDKEPERRYRNAVEFGDDLRALLEYRAIVARPAGLVLRATRFCRRHPALAVAAVLTTCAVIAIPVALEISRRDAAKAQLQDAKADLRDLVALRARRAEIHAALSPLERALNLRPLERAEIARVFSLRRERDEVEQRLDATYLRALSSATDSKPTLGDARVEPLIAELHLERFRRAIDDGDESAAAVYASLVEASDREGRHRDTLVPRHAVSFTSDPSGAVVSLHRYLDASTLSEGGEPRFVPVPVDLDGRPVPTPVTPGTLALRVVVAAEDIAVGDLILRYAGRPIADTILVPYDGKDQVVRAFDRLVAVDGRPIREAEDVTLLYDDALANPEVTRRFEFERDGATFVVDTLGLDDLGIKAWEPDNVLSEVGGRVTLHSRGEVIERDVPPLITRTTAAPCFDSPSNAIGRTPHSVQLPAGSYLAIVSSPGRESQRLPFVVGRDRGAEVACWLAPEGTTPRGFVFVPGGRFAAGGDSRSFAGFEASEVMVEDFWVAERELVFAEWLQFLNDPDVLRTIAASKEPIRYPRDGITGELHPKWSRLEDGSFTIPSGRAMFPLSQVSYADVLAYLEWRNAKAREDGLPFEFALPTEFEWEKAARGADRRAFVFGNVFSPTWVKGRFGHRRLGPELVMRFPIDESPYGVFDLTGSLWEACCEPWSAESAEFGRAVRGGDWNMIYEANFRAASRAEVSIEGVSANLGFRIVLHRRNVGDESTPR